MKRNLLVQIACLLVLAGGLNLEAANGSWTGATDATWAGANWSASPVPGTGNTATFNGAGNANTTVDLGSGVTILNLLFDTGSAAAYNIGNGAVGSQTLTLNNGGAITLNSTVANNQLFNAAITLGTDKTAQTYTLTDNSGSSLTLASNITGNNVSGTAGIKTLVVAGSGNTTLGGIIAPGGASSLVLTKNGAGTLTLNGSSASTYAGATTVNAGTLLLDFANRGASAVNVISGSSALALGGGTFQIKGNASGTASAQTVNGVTFNAGYSQISAGNSSPTLTLGAMTPNLGGSVMFTGPANDTYSSGNSATPTPVSATSVIKTTTPGLGSMGLVTSGTGFPTMGAYATVGLYDWAATNAGSPATIIGGSQISGFYSTASFGGANLDVPATGFALPSGTQNGHTIRFNTPSATANTPTVVSNPIGDNVGILGILVTPNMGAQNAGISGVTWGVVYGTTANKNCALQLWQNNTLGFFNFAASFYNGRGSSPSINSIVQNGAGTVVYSGANTQTGPTYLNGGYSVIGLNSHFGAPATAAAVYLNGGTVVATNTFALDNAGANVRPITLLANGGGLAATAGNTLTVDGQIGSAAGTGPLVIGIPASTANGGVAGLLPGTGSLANGQAADTANPTPVFATGTVALTYPNAGNGNYQYGGTLITGGATLAINSQYALGGADQGPTIFNGGKLQYTATLSTGTAGTVLDISGQPVTFNGNATIDVNGHAVTYANAIGNGGSGALTVASTLPNGILTLTGSNNYTGGTTISSGTLRINNTTGSGTGSGNVTIASGGALAGIGTISGAVTNLSGGHLAPGNGGLGTNTVGALTMNSGSLYDFEFSGTANDQTVVSTSGGLTINGGAFNLYQPGNTFAYTTTGTYNLIQYSGAIGGPGLDSTWTTASAVNPHIANPQAGLAYAFGTSGEYLTLTISTAGVTAVWANDADGNWSDGTKWSSNPSVPHAAGDAATFGVGSALRTVSLNVNETVGGMFFTNANSFVIANAGNALTLDNSGVGVSVSVSAGAANAIQTSVSLNDNAQITVSSGDSLALSGVISNAPSVTKTLAFNGAGTNILSAANTYGPAAGSTGTTLSGGGVLQVANNFALGAGDLSITANNTLQAGAPGLSVGNNIAVGLGATATVDNNGNALLLGGVISGSGALTKVSNGTLALGGNNSYSGNTTVNAGTLSISSAANVAGTPNIILNGGSLLGNGSFAIAKNIGIGLASGSANTTALIDAAGSFTNNGIIASAGNTGVNSLTVNSLGGSGTLILGGANTFNGVASISNGVLQVANTLALQNSTLEYDAGLLLFDSSITAATFGGLSGTNLTGIGLTNLSGAALTLTVGNNNSTTTYYGGLSGIGGLSKLGTGTLTLSNLTYTGNTIVYSGGLNINAPTILTSHLDISAQYGVGAANVVVNGASVTSPNGLYITSPTGSSGTIYGFGANLTGTNGAQLTANADGNGRAISYGAGNGRPGSGSLTIGTAGDTATLVTANGALDLFYSSGGSSVANFAVNLNGGTLAVNNIQESTYGNQSGTFKFNGGTLKALANDGAANFFPATPAQLTAVVNGGAIIDDNGFSITIAKALTHGTGTPDGGLTKLGAGTLTLDAANSYTGNTTVSNGVLALGASGSIATSSNIIVGGSATFDVSALGGFALGSSQTLSNSSSTATLGGNFTTGNGTVALTYASGTPAISVTNGTLTISSGTTFKVNNTGAALAVGSYKLISTNLNGSGFVSPGTLPAVTVIGNGVVGGAGTPELQVNKSELYLLIPSGVNTNPTNITAVVTGSTLKLGWPEDYRGWTLQTNSVDLANTNYWFPYPGSASVTNVDINIDPTQAKVFFRLVYP